MNNNETEIYKIADIVVGCCANHIGDRLSFDRDDILGKCRKEELVMAMCILVQMLIYAGYSISIISQFLGRTKQAIFHLKTTCKNFHDTNRPFRIAESEALLRCKSIFDMRH